MNSEGTSSRKVAIFDSLQQEAFLSLWRTYDRLRAIEDQFFSEFELTAQQYNILRLLKGRHPTPSPTLDLAERLVSRAPDITRMLDKLEQRGLIERVRSESDRRSVLVGLTPAGVEMVDSIGAKIIGCHQNQLGHVSENDLQTLLELLRKIRAPHEVQESSWR